jgi:hypothetical protein
MSDDHAKFKFSITCQTDDLAVLHCLRALCQYVEKHKNRQIGWGGTGEPSWRENSKRVTFRFTDPHYRDQFINEVNRLLSGKWVKVAISDNDPAKPQR